MPDIGAGSGYFTRRFAMHAGKAYAVDIDSKLLQIALKDAPRNVEAVLATPDDPKLPAGRPRAADFRRGTDWRMEGGWLYPEQELDFLPYQYFMVFGTRKSAMLSWPRVSPVRWSLEYFDY